MATQSPLAVESKDNSLPPREEEPKISGSCACGITKWEASSLPNGVWFCHCTTCQKISGGTHIAFIDLAMSDVEWNHGEGSEDIGRINDMEEKDKQGKLKVMSISKSAERGFCGACGSTLTMRYFTSADCVYLTLGSVDFAGEGFLEGLKKNHIYVREMGKWDKLPDDGWPRWETMPNEKKNLGIDEGVSKV